MVLVAVGYLAAVDPNRPGHYPGCPILAISGYYCPGCGGLRAIHDLAHGQPKAALSANLVVTLLAPVAIIGWAIWTRNRLQRRPNRVRVGPWALVLGSIVLIAFAVLRNVPGLSWLAP
jgi:hypothetical protein